MVIWRRTYGKGPLKQQDRKPAVVTSSLKLAGQVRSGQVRVFNVHIKRKLLQHMPVIGIGAGLCRFLCPVQKKREGREWEGDRLHWRVQRSTRNLTRAELKLAARDLLYAPSSRQQSTYHSLCYNSRGVLAGKRYISMGLPWGIDPTTHCTINRCYTTDIGTRKTPIAN